MKTIIFSVYYPHNHLQLIIRECLFPLAVDLKENYSSRLLNYHLSSYKGENITFEYDYMDGAQRETLIGFIKQKVEEYFKMYPFAQPEIKFPLNRLFLDIPIHTIHFWENSPFKVKIFLASDPEGDQRIKSLIAGQCLHYFSASDKYFVKSLFKFYIQIIIIINKVLKESNRSKASNIEISVFSRLKELKKNSLDAISLLENKSTQFYFQNREALDKEIEMIYKQIEFPEEENVNIPLHNWKSLMEEIENISSIDNITAKEEFYTGLILNLSQKFSLQVDEFIKAAMVLREFNNLYL